MRYSISGQSAGKEARALRSESGRAARLAEGSFSHAVGGLVEVWAVDREDSPKKSPPELVRMPDCFVRRSVTALFAKARLARDEPVITFTL